MEGGETHQQEALDLLLQHREEMGDSPGTRGRGGTPTGGLVPPPSTQGEEGDSQGRRGREGIRAVSLDLLLQSIIPSHSPYPLQIPNLPLKTFFLF